MFLHTQATLPHFCSLLNLHRFSSCVSHGGGCVTASITNCRPLWAPSCPSQTFVNVGHWSVALTATRAAAAVLLETRTQILQRNNSMFCPAGVCVLVCSRSVSWLGSYVSMNQALLLLIEHLSSRRMHIDFPTSSSVLSTFSVFPRSSELQK